MIDIKSSTGQKLTFDIDVQGATEKDIVGKMRIQREDVEYGFDAVIEDGKMTVDLPALDTVMLDLKNGAVLESKLDIIANSEFYTEAWKDSIKIERPIAVKATVTESTSTKKKVTVKVSKSGKAVVTEGSGSRKKAHKLPKDKASHNLASQKRKFPQSASSVEEKIDHFISKYK